MCRMSEINNTWLRSHAKYDLFSGEYTFCINMILQEPAVEMRIWLAGYNMNKRLSQQPALGALTFSQSFVAGKANFCSQLLASYFIRLGVAEVISAVTSYLLPASK